MSGLLTAGGSMAERWISYFAFLKFTEHYWQTSEAEREIVRSGFLQSIQQLNSVSYLYQVFPLSSETDVLFWTSKQFEESRTLDDLFVDLARALNSQKYFLQPIKAWWGFTRPSDYAKGKSAQEIDVLDSRRKKYLTIYPFTKTAEWYQLKRDSRQGMMNEHIRIGHQYQQINQLLLYSTGLQDQEFIVVYEMDDLVEFSALVSELRSSDARRYTLNDMPIYSAIYHPSQETMELFK